jgi:hypothetical protein
MDDHLMTEGNAPIDPAALIEALKDNAPRMISGGPTRGGIPSPIPEAIGAPEASQAPLRPSEPSVVDNEKEDSSLVGQIKRKVNLPDQATIDSLKKQYGQLTVIPFISENTDEKIHSAIVRPLTRGEWRSCQEVAMKRAEGGGKPPEEYFQERIVEVGLVWPKLSPVQFDAQRAGFIPTIYGVIERISWFFDVNTLLNLTFTL